MRSLSRESTTKIKPRGVVEIVSPEGRCFSWPPTSHTVNITFLYCTFSTLKFFGGGAREKTRGDGEGEGEGGARTRAAARRKTRVSTTRARGGDLAYRGWGRC